MRKSSGVEGAQTVKNNLLVSAQQGVSQKIQNGKRDVLNKEESNTTVLDVISKLHEEVQLLQAELVKTRQGLAQREILLRNSAEMI